VAHNKYLLPVRRPIDVRFIELGVTVDSAKKHFDATPMLDNALATERPTTRKRANPILNVDGCITALFIDMICSCGAFSREECDDLQSFECLNGLFVLGRSIGFPWTSTSASSLRLSYQLLNIGDVVPGMAVQLSLQEQFFQIMADAIRVSWCRLFHSNESCMPSA